MDSSTDKPRNGRSLKDYFYILFSGLAMGAADVVPGVSGGTMAFILGIYTELLDSIKSFNVQLLGLLRKGQVLRALDHVNWKFLCALFIGLGSAILTLARVITFLYEHHQSLLFSFFFGLVLASIVVVGGHVRWKAVTIVSFLLGTAIAYAIVRAVPVSMPSDPFTLLWSGAVAIIAMILPGISGSFILLILGQYHHVITAVKSLDVITLLPFAVGATIGILAFSRVLSWVLHSYRQVMISFLTGFMAGSLWKIWPFRIALETVQSTSGKIIPVKEQLFFPDVTANLFWSILLMVAGLVLVIGFDRIQRRIGGIREIGG